MAIPLLNLNDKIFFCILFSLSQFSMATTTNPFTPPSSSDSESGGGILSAPTLEEGLRQAQLRGMQSVERKFGQVEAIYRSIHGEAVSQQAAVESVEAETLKTSLLTGDAVEELKKAKAKRDRRLRLKLYCIGIFLFVLVIWLLLVVGLPHN